MANTLPAYPGLLAPGAPVLWHIPDSLPRAGTLVAVEYDGALVRLAGYSGLARAPVEHLTLRLDDEAGIGQHLARRWIGRRVALPGRGVPVLRYMPPAYLDQVAAWVLTNDTHAFWFTDWLPAFDGLPMPTLAEGRLAIRALPTDPALALIAIAAAVAQLPERT